jgi:arylsulfatase A-like enzyme
MKRKPRPYITFVAVCAGLLGALTWANAAFAAVPSRPNILFILADDLGYGDIGMLFQNQRAAANNRGKAWHATPQLDRMAAEGIQLRHHYCPASVCAPSRASLLLGVHQGHANVRDNQFDKGLENNHTLATVLRQAGYMTACIGKWGLQGNGANPAAWPAYPTKRGFDYFLGYVRHKDGHEHYPKEGLYDGAKEVWDMNSEISSGLDKCYTADLFTARAKKWIQDQHTAHPAQPFFLYLAFDTPHAVQEFPTQAFPAGGGAKGGLQWLGTPGQMINTAGGKVDSYCHPDYANATYDDDGKQATPEVPWPEVYKRYATAVRRVDDCVGDLLQLLKDLDLDRNTLVVFTSDNGPSIESYLRENLAANFFDSFGPFDGIKRDLWEGGLRVPALVRWPGHIPAGKLSAQPCQSHDWLPTFAELAGLAAPARSDGVSLVPTLLGKPGQRPSTVYSEYYFKGAPTPNYSVFLAAHRNRTRNQMQAIRLGDLLGVRYNINSQADNFEIYNVVTDPQESKNLAADEGYARLQQQMKDAVLQVRRPDSSAPRPYDTNLVPASVAARVTPGIEWRAFAQAFPWVPELAVMTPSSRSTTNAPTVTVRPRDSDFGLLFTGYVSVPRDGEYVFYLTADSGALLRIHEATVVDADFEYEAGTERSGTIRLQAGQHPFRLYYAHAAKGTPALSWQWSGPGIAKQAVPPAAFFRDNPPPPTAN